MSRSLSDIEAQQSLLRGDLETVRRYGADHPEDWAGIRFDNGDFVRIVAAFSSRTDAHRRALMELVDHPERIEVVHLVHSTRQLEDILAVIREELRSGINGPLRGSGIRWGAISLRLAATAEATAEDLANRYGDALDITVGGLPYPPGRRVDGGTARPALEPVTIEGLGTEILLGDEPLYSGVVGRGRIALRNVGIDDIRLQSEQPLVASLLEVGTGRRLGVFNGAIAGTGLLIQLPPGGESFIGLLIGTDSCDPEIGYLLPAGAYLVHTEVPVSRGPRSQRMAVPVQDCPVRLEKAPSP